MWDTRRIVIFCIPFALAIVGGLIWLVIRRTLRTRLRMMKQLKADPDVTDWLVIFDWSRKVLYIPTIIASGLAFVLMAMMEAKPGMLPSGAGQVVAGVWLAIVFINFAIDEYEISVKILLILTLGALAIVLWLVLMDWLTPFLQLFGRIHANMNATFYLLVTIVLITAVFTSWLKGLFYYVAITPNYLNVQTGPTETAEQISREDYNTRIDTNDFLERMLGFGRIVITFKNPGRLPITLLVGRIGTRAEKLESIRGTLSVEHSNHEKSSEQASQ